MITVSLLQCRHRINLSIKANVLLVSKRMISSTKLVPTTPIDQQVPLAGQPKHQCFYSSTRMIIFFSRLFSSSSRVGQSWENQQSTYPSASQSAKSKEWNWSSTSCLWSYRLCEPWMVVQWESLVEQYPTESYATANRLLADEFINTGHTGPQLSRYRQISWHAQLEQYHCRHECQRTHTQSTCSERFSSSGDNTGPQASSCRVNQHAASQCEFSPSESGDLERGGRQPYSTTVEWSDIYAFAECRC